MNTPKPTPTNLKIGTPKTLAQAIQNALLSSDSPSSKDIEAHVRDYLSQKFGVVMMDLEESQGHELQRIQALWNAITQEKLGEDRSEVA